MRLRRELGFWNSVSMALGAMIGGGIFVLSGIGAGIAGPSVLIAFAIAGLLALFNGLSTAELGAAIPKSGATYEYARELISPFTGFFAGWIFIVSKILEAATVALAFGSYLFLIAQIFNESFLAIFISLVLTAIIYFGIKITSEVNNVFVLIKLAVLSLFVVFGINFVNINNYTPFFATDTYNLLQVAGLLFFAYTGYARISSIGEEIKDPKKNIPRATLIALLISFVLYMLVTAIAIGMVGSSSLGSTNSPIAFAASITGNFYLTLIVTFGALIATLNVVFSDILAVSRTVFAMSRNKDLPNFLCHVDRRGSPTFAVIIAGLIVTFLALISNIKTLALFTSLTILIYYAVTNFTALKLDKKERKYPKIISVLGLVGCILLVLFMPLREWILTLIVITVGILYFKFKK